MPNTSEQLRRNRDRYVSRAVREAIEDTLLLPLAEIERRSTADELGQNPGFFLALIAFC